MKIDLDGLTNAELAQIARDATALLALRLGGSASTPHEPSRAPADKDFRPVQADCNFVLYVKSRMKRGEYITASERQRIAEIAAQHEDWVRRQGLPIVSNTAPWRNATKFLATRLPNEV
jgi:hypothetical protein